MNHSGLNRINIWTIDSSVMTVDVYALPTQNISFFEDNHLRQRFSMNSTASIRRLHEHRMWVNHGLIDAVQSLTQDQLRQSLPIGQGTVWKTLTHMMAAEYVWLETLLGNETATMPGDAPNRLPGNQEGNGAIQTMDELVNRWHQLDTRWQAYLSSITDESLDDIVFRISTSSGAGKRFGTKRSDILLHVCTHAHYTTAQLVNMLRQLGQTEFPDTMLITMARQSQ